MENEANAPFTSDGIKIGEVFGRPELVKACFGVAGHDFSAEFPLDGRVLSERVKSEVEDDRCCLVSSNDKGNNVIEEFVIRDALSLFGIFVCAEQD